MLSRLSGVVRAGQESTMSLWLKHFQKRRTSSLILAVQMVLKLNYITFIFHDKMVYMSTWSLASFSLGRSMTIMSPKLVIVLKRDSSHLNLVNVPLKLVRSSQVEICIKIARPRKTAWQKQRCVASLSKWRSLVSSKHKLNNCQLGKQIFRGYDVSIDFGVHTLLYWEKRNVSGRKDAQFCFVLFWAVRARTEH